MKSTRSFLTAALFMLAVGGAFASEFFVTKMGYSKKADVTGQIPNCVYRKDCNGGTVACQITLDPDGSGPLGNITVDLFETNVTCVTPLFEH